MSVLPLWRRAGSVLLLVGLLMGSSRSARSASFLGPIRLEKPGAGALVATDLDGDGNPDIVVAGSGGVSLFYGNGDGTFAPRVDLFLGDGVNGIAVGDVDGDGAPDLLLTQGNFLQVLLNLGQRAYASDASYPIGGGPSGLTVGDFNGDRRLDVAVSNSGSDTMGVLLNQGGGMFSPALFYPTGHVPGNLTHGDFNGDGKVDLAVANILGFSVRVYLGQGDGTFLIGDDCGVGQYSGQVVCADLNGDGKPDLAAPNWMDGSVSLLYGDGTGHFPSRIDYPGNSYPSVIDAVDLEGDGNTDLVWANGGSDYFTVLDSKGRGSFSPPLRFLSGGSNTRTMAVADFNRDGLPDVATGNESSGTVGIALNVSNQISPGPAGHLMASLPIPDSGTGHWYQVIELFDAITWTGARNAAEVWQFHGMRGHLATLSSEAESRFLLQTVFPTASRNDRFWIGGYQDRSAPDFREPAGGWRWVTGEPFTFTNWGSNQPDNAGDEDVMEIHANGLTNDLPGSVPLGAYIVEYEPAAAPGIAQLVIAPETVEGGTPTSGQVTLTRPAGTGGAVVTISGNNPAAATVPATVRVPEGNMTARFTVTTSVVSDPTVATISAGFAGNSMEALLRVIPAQPSLPAGHERVSLPVFNSANGHWYQAIRVSGWIAWPDANAAARRLSFAGLSGHLVTLTSTEESNFVSSELMPALAGNQRCWIGAYQDLTAPGYSEPEGGWRWVTGEPFTFTNWIGGEPNNAGGDEHFAELQRERGDQWNDVSATTPHDVYLVEFETPGPIQPPDSGAPRPDLRTDPGQLQFGEQPAGTSSAEQEVRFTNAGTAPLSLQSVTLTGDQAADFAIADVNGVVLTHGQTGTIRIRFVPRAAGPCQASLTIRDNAPGSPHMVALQGTGVAPQLTIHISRLISPASFSFGPQPVGVPSGAQTITITNSGTSPLVIMNLGISGGIRGEFTIVTDSRETTLGPGASRTLALGFRPVSLGSRSATLTVADNSDGSPHRVELSGEGIPAAPVAPANLVVTAAPEGQLWLAWLDNSGNETAFAVWRKSNTDDWTRVAVLAPNITRFKDRSVVSGTRYTYRVRATNNIGASAWTNEAGGTAPLGPQAPIDLTVAAGPDGSLDLEWTDGSRDETAFAVWRRSETSDWSRIAVIAPDTTHYRDRDTGGDVRYFYRVRAINASGASIWTNVATVAPLPPLGAPANLTAVALAPAVVRLTWSDGSSSETGFGIWREAAGGTWERIGVAPADATSFTDTVLRARTAYSYQIRAHNNSRVSGWSNEAAVTTPPTR